MCCHDHISAYCETEVLKACGAERGASQGEEHHSAGANTVHVRGSDTNSKLLGGITQGWCS